jgi:hypothetical protein
MLCRLQKCLFFSLVILLAACDSHSGQPNQTDRDTLPSGGTKIPVDTIHLKYNQLINTIPVPFEILNKLSSTYLVYKPGLINPLASLNGYNQRESKSLNLGVYGADLTYMLSLGEFKGFAPHVKAIKRLADELNIPLAFDDEMMSRYSANPPNRDTLQNALYTSYHEIDRTLKANDRVGMAALVVCGGWVESLYLTTQTIGENENTGKFSELYKLVLLQKKHLGNLISLLNDFQTDPFKKIVFSLHKIDKLYEAHPENKSMNNTEVKNITAELAGLRTLIITEN